MRKGSRLTIQVVDSLPAWAHDLLAARWIQRMELMFRKSHPRVTAWRLFRELSTRIAVGGRVADLEAKFSALFVDDEPEWRRFAIETAILGCRTSGADRLVRVSQLNPYVLSPDIDADRKLHLQTLTHDVMSVLEHASADAAKTGLTSLWPVGEPMWLKEQWPSVKQYRDDQKRMNARVWWEDAPAFVFGAVPRVRLSPDVPGEARRAFGPLRTVCRFRGAKEMGPFQARSVRFIEKKVAVRSFSVEARHRFGAPAPRHLLAAFRARVRGHAEMETLAALYAEHDGARLFNGVFLDAPFYMLALPGLKDQRRAVRHFRYNIEECRIDDHSFVSEFLRGWGADLDSVHILAISRRFIFFMPLRGAHAGRVFRFLSVAQHVPVWAEDPIAAISAIVSKIKTLSQRLPLLRPLEDETKPDRLTAFTLAGIRPLKEGKSRR